MTDINLTQIWTPLGSDTNRFSGELNGNYYHITGLQNGNTSRDYQGLFGYIDGGKVSNLTVEGRVEGGSYIGMLVGKNSGTIDNVKVRGTVKGYKWNSSVNHVGGLVGDNKEGWIERCYSDAVVVASSPQYSVSVVGGLVGGNSGCIRMSGCSGTVSATAKVQNVHVGGMVGLCSNGTIENAYSTGEVIGKTYVGGLIGNVDEGTITNAYTISKTTGENGYVGGLVYKNNR